MPPTFHLRATDRAARVGTLTTPHGAVETPVFMPVGTQATVKAMTPRALEEVGARIVLANTYHLYLRLGAEIVERAGGLHGFMRWDGPILTDSGGFQVWSLSERRTVTPDGVRFRSHIDGSEHLFTPESVMRTQERLGADIVMALDECAPHTADPQYIRAAMERTHAWAVRCREAHTRRDQALFGIVQGGVSPELRRESAAFLSALDFPGYGIGGLSVGEDKQSMRTALEAATGALPAGKPRYLMGVGAPEDLLDGIAAGVDMFDCVLPTRNARTGALLVPAGRLNIRNGAYREDFLPVEEGCPCYTCATFSRAYLHHLFRAEELLGYTLATIHNLSFLIRLMDGARSAIRAGDFAGYRARFLATYSPPDPGARERNRAARERVMRSRGERPSVDADPGGCAVSDGG